MDDTIKQNAVEYVLDIPINSLKELPNNERLFGYENLETIRDDILANGLKTPLIIYKINNELTIVSGNTRFLAIKEIYNKGLSYVYKNKTYNNGNVPCIYRGESNLANATKIAVSSNKQRANTTEYTKAQVLYFSEQYNREDDNVKNSKSRIKYISELLHITDRRVQDFIHADGTIVEKSKNDEEKSKALLKKLSNISGSIQKITSNLTYDDASKQIAVCIKKEVEKLKSSSNELGALVNLLIRESKKNNKTENKYSSKENIIDNELKEENVLDNNALKASASDSYGDEPIVREVVIEENHGGI